MKKLFEKGHKLSKGRPVGSKNSSDLNSLKILLSETFSENRPWIKECISQMLNDLRKHLNELNKRISEVKEDDKEYTSNLRFLCVTRSTLLEEFKWLMQLKANFEPKDPQVVINNDNSKHTHYTTIQVDNLKGEELMDLLMGRNNGRLDAKQSA